MTFAEASWVRALGVQMCLQWDIDPNACMAIDVRWRPDEVPTALVTLELNEGVVHELLHLVPLMREVVEPDDE